MDDGTKTIGEPKLAVLDLAVYMAGATGCDAQCHLRRLRPRGHQGRRRPSRLFRPDGQAAPDVRRDGNSTALRARALVDATGWARSGLGLARHCSGLIVVGCVFTAMRRLLRAALLLKPRSV